VEIQYYGANCVRLTTKKATIVIDDNLVKLGLKTVTKPNDVSLRTSKEFPLQPTARFRAETPGQYEISGVIIHGIGARAHMDEEGGQNAVIYTLSADDVKVAVIGHIFPQLTEDQLEEIGMIDVVIVPVGGNGYTLDGVGALKVIKQLEPKLIIPTHYADKQINYEMPQQDLSEALKGLAMEPAETLPKIKIKPAELTDSARLVVLERQ
jgi:L-ascorbate metabolism protein UlaG (beta-lactamase superfamily)